MVSIVISVFNVAPYVEKCINSCLKQTYKDIELIVVEDCSTDNSLQLVEELAKTDERIRIIRHEVNEGAGKSRKDGIESAKGDFVITIDSDDWVSENFIEALVKRQEETDADIVSGGITIIYPTGRIKSEVFGEKISEGSQKLIDYNDGTIIFLNNKLVRRSLYDIVPYSTRRFCEDTPVIIPLLYHANKLAYCNNPGYYYLQRDGSLCHTVSLVEQNVCKGLCAFELIEYFKDKDKDDFNKLLNANLVKPYVEFLRHNNFTKEDIKNVKDEFCEFGIHLLKFLQ